jgi:tetratricopeptide (TPR) repeat protein
MVWYTCASHGGIQALASQYPAIPTYRSALALAHRDAGRRSEAAALFATLVADDLAAFPKDGNRPIALAILADVCAFLEDQDAAALLYRELLPMADRCIVTGPATNTIGSAALSLGSLAATMGRFDEAEEHFENAIAMNQRLRTPTWVAETQLRYTRMLLKRDGPGDR